MDFTKGCTRNVTRKTWSKRISFKETDHKRCRTNFSEPNYCRFLKELRTASSLNGTVQSKNFKKLNARKYVVLLLSATTNVETIVSRDHSPFAKSIALWFEPMPVAADGTPFLRPREQHTHLFWV